MEELVTSQYWLSNAARIADIDFNSGTVLANFAESNMIRFLFAKMSFEHLKNEKLLAPVHKNYGDA